MKADKIQTRRLAWVLLAGLLPLLLVVGLSLLLSHVQALAQPAADLDVTKEVNRTVAAPGETLVYTVTIQDNRSVGGRLWLTDTLPPELDCVSLDASVGDFGVENDVITWTSDMYGNGYTAYIYLSAEISPDIAFAAIENTAQVTGTGELILASATTAVKSSLDNEDTAKAVTPGLAVPGDVVTYTLVLSNASTINDVLVRVTDPLHPLLHYVTDSVRTVPEGSGTLVTPDALASASGITWTVDVTSAMSVTLIFQAQVSDSASDGDVVVNTATVRNVSDGSILFERSATLRVDLPPTSQTRFPEKWTLITQKEPLTITGVAWDGNDRPGFPSDPVLNPINNDDGDGTYYVTWADVPSALNYTLQEADNPYFEEPYVYDPATSPKYVSGKAPGTYYYRLQAHNVDGASRWSNVESVVVQTTQAVDSSSAPASSPALVAPTRVMAGDPVTVWVRIDNGPWQTATVTAEDNWWEWEYLWTLPEEREIQHTIQTRARDTAGNIGAIDTITVTVDNEEYVMYFPRVYRRWPPVPKPPTLYDIQNNDDGRGNGDGDYVVSWSYGHSYPSLDYYVLQESKDDAHFSSPTDYSPTTGTSRTFTDKEPGTYYYRVRGYNSYGPGEWSAVKAVVVTPPPYAPTLNDIPEPDDEGNYTVSWSYGYSYPPVDSYTLQEATDANFSSPAEYYPGTSTSQAIYGKEPGTYYYRVRGHNVSGPGEWSAVKSVSVRSYSYYYDFNSSTKIVNPWPIRRTSYWEGDVKTKATWTEEHDGTIYIVMDDRFDFSIASPMEVAPAPPYVIETRVKIHDPANLVAYGIIFGGNGGSPCPAYRDTGCLTHYYRLEAINHGKLKVGLKRIDYHEPESSDDRGKARGKELIDYKDISGDGDDWNTWKIVVKSDGIKIYVGGDLWGSTDDDKYVNEPYFGIYASANEYKPAIGRYDYYYVTPD